VPIASPPRLLALLTCQGFQSESAPFQPSEQANYRRDAMLLLPMYMLIRYLPTVNSPAVTAAPSQTSCRSSGPVRKYLEHHSKNTVVNPNASVRCTMRRMIARPGRNRSRQPACLCRSRRSRGNPGRRPKNRGGGNSPGRARVVDLTALPAKAPLDIGGIEPLEPLDRNRAKVHDRPGIERIGHRHRLRVFVDLDAAGLYLGEGMAAIAECRQQTHLGRHHRSSACQIAGLERKPLFVVGEIDRGCLLAPSTLTEATWWSGPGSTVTVILAGPASALIS
jgi:hypothetical protein